MKRTMRSSLIATGAALLLAHCAPASEVSLQQPQELESVTDRTIAERAQEIYRSPEDLVLGNPSGKVTVVEFFDYNCGYCRRAIPEVAKLIKSDQDVRVVIKEFPILGPGSIFAAKAALASGQQGKYLEFHAALNAVPGVKDENSVLRAAQQIGLDVDKLKIDMENQAVVDVIRRNYKIAKSLSISGTPTFVIDDAIEPSFAPYKVLAQHVASVRHTGGCKVC